jgi:hypothetical protein
VPMRPGRHAGAPVAIRKAPARSRQTKSQSGMTIRRNLIQL